MLLRMYNEWDSSGHEITLDQVDMPFKLINYTLVILNCLIIKNIIDASISMKEQILTFKLSFQ